MEKLLAEAYATAVQKYAKKGDAPAN
jgi:hypothetical protein